MKINTASCQCQMTGISRSTLQRIQSALLTGLDLAKQEYETALSIFNDKELLQIYYYAEQVEQIRQAVDVVDNLQTWP